MKSAMFLLTAVPVLSMGLLGANFPDPPTGNPPAAEKGKATAVLAGGCFWGMQGVFEHVKGVTDTVVGYAGGSKSTAEYETVSTGTTGHAESLKITYEPSQITYGELLKIYFGAAHDPTTLNRQHYDVGTQYRSSIFYSDDEQKRIAEAYIQELNGQHVFKSAIVTKVTPLQGFYPAEEYHQHYLDRNPFQPYIANVDIPLLNNFKKTFPEYYKK